MKITRLCFLAFILICSKAFALEGKGVTLISERTEAPPFANFKIIHIKKLKPFGSAIASAKAYNVSGKVNQPIVMRGNHSFSVTNNTKSYQSYSYRFSLIPPDGPPYSQAFVISVQPGGNAFDAAASWATSIHQTPGKWGFMAATEVYGESSKRSMDNASLTVSK